MVSKERPPFPLIISARIEPRAQSVLTLFYLPPLGGYLPRKLSGGGGMGSYHGVSATHAVNYVCFPIKCKIAEGLGRPELSATERKSSIFFSRTSNQIKWLQGILSMLSTKVMIVYPTLLISQTRSYFAPNFNAKDTSRFNSNLFCCSTSHARSVSLSSCAEV